MRWINACVLCALSACSPLPKDGPAKWDINGGASAALVGAPGQIVYDYALVDIDANVLDVLAATKTDPFGKAFSGLGSSSHPPALKVGEGDVLQVAVFESTPGGLFQPQGQRDSARPFVSFPNLTVSGSGNISVPYAGVIRVAGLTVPQIEREIKVKLEKDALDPQVVVTLVEQNKSAVTVIGDAVGGNNRYKLTAAGERILDLISKAGGIRYPGFDVSVKLRRNNRLKTLPFWALVANPSENIYVEAGDLIYVYKDPRRFIAAGAVGATSGGASIGGSGSLVGAVGMFSFDQEHLSLSEAIAKAGGLMDGRSDAGNVFLFREERREILERMGLDLSKFPPSQGMIPAIYRANYRDPSSFFYTQRFEMHTMDTIYIGNADAVELAKLIGYVQTVTGGVSTVATDLNTIWPVLRR
jgi:polysaccharide biosynthesis/export protein